VLRVAVRFLFLELSSDRGVWTMASDWNPQQSYGYITAHW